VAKLQKRLVGPLSSCRRHRSPTANEALPAEEEQVANSTKAGENHNK
jgi:hypothetical protein